MKLSDARAILRERLDDPAEPYLWSNATIDGYINQAIEEACFRARLIGRQLDIQVEADVNEYALDPAVFALEMTGRYFVGSQPWLIVRGSIEDFTADNPRWHTTTGRPHFYAFQQRPGAPALFLDRVPTAAATLTVFGSVMPEPLTSPGDETELDDRTMRNVLLFAEHLAYSKRDADTSNEALAKERLDQFTAIFGTRPTERQHRKQQERRISVVSYNQF